MSLRSIDDQLHAESQAEQRHRLLCGFRALVAAIAAAEAVAHGMGAALRRAA
jgi:hypothetical protein